MVAYRPAFFTQFLFRYANITRSVEFAVLTLDPTTKQPKAKIYRPAEIDALLQTEGLGKKDEDTEMKTA
jgi:20S proteasome subunit alpha 3